MRTSRAWTGGRARALRAWIVTGAPARGMAFIIDFTAAIIRLLTGRRSRDDVR